ncbi:hypothetical protein BT93_L5791 [Corymbia citriodora subsp. variegata]|uniref:Uncharacterized protein n=1 Tax=Corymbia citriodora subsp. variegata TaxID=360336 RepID=A0A8T0CRI8_CORYI|nr:hypothetical protein BT93_L5791 [Corymbia citriodora subsp. variegata]
MARPLFVFVLCNAIIAALLAKPGRFYALRPQADDDGGGVAEELYEEIVKISESRARPVLPQFREAEEVVYEDKEIISEVSTAVRARGGDADDFEGDAAEDEDEECRGLRPPEAEKRPRTTRSGRDSRESSFTAYDNCGGSGCHDEELSNEEFQRAIEAFIAKQLRFRREESLAIVLQSH